MPTTDLNTAPTALPFADEGGQSQFIGFTWVPLT
jgi:hypothetical protein